MLPIYDNVKTFCVNYTGAQTNAVVIAGIASTQFIVTGYCVSTANSNTVDVSFRLGFGTTVPNYGNAQLLDTSPGIAPGSGKAAYAGEIALGLGASGDDIRFTCSVPTGGSVDVCVKYIPIGV